MAFQLRRDRQGYAERDPRPHENEPGELEIEERIYEERERDAMEERERREREERERRAMEERERRAMEEGERRAMEERERRAMEERERRAMEEGERRAMEERRRQLIVYQFGDKIHLASFRGLNLDDVTNLRLAMFGPTGSGKSCFVNTCSRVVLQKPKGAACLESAGSEGTIILEEFFHEMPLIRLVDTRGLHNFNQFEIREFEKLLRGIQRPGDVINRDASYPEYEIGADVPFGSWVHAVIFIVKAIDVRLLNGDLEKYLKPLRDMLRPLGIDRFFKVPRSFVCLQHIEKTGRSYFFNITCTCFFLTTRNVSHYCSDPSRQDTRRQVARSQESSVRRNREFSSEDLPTH